MRLSRVVSSVLLVAMGMLLGGSPSAQEGAEGNGSSGTPGATTPADDHSVLSDVEARTPRSLPGEAGRAVGTAGPSAPADAEGVDPNLAAMDRYAEAMERRAREIVGRDRAGVEVAR